MTQVTIQQAFQLALQHHQAGRLREAEQLYRQILAQQPQHIDALHLLGVSAHQGGRIDIAVDLIRRAIALQPDFTEAYCNLGNALKDKGQLDDAIAAYRQALAIKPDFAEAHYNLGNALREKGQLDAAIAAYQQASALRPDFAEAFNNLGNALNENGQFVAAIAACRQAIALRPNYAEALNNLGNALKENGQFDGAIAACRRAIAVRPNYPQAHYNLGNALRAKGQVDEAIAAYRQAIALKPNYAEVHNNLGTALAVEGQLDSAIAAYRQAIALRPGFSDAHSNLIFSMHFCPDYDANAIAQELCRWNRQHAEPLSQFIQPHCNDRSPDRPLRIGYLSPDLREHVVGRSLLPLLLQHDRGQFQIFCYSNVRCPDAVTSQLQQHADDWRNIVGLSDDQAAGQIREDRIDILVDLTLHTADSRLLVFARKPAPVQVTYLGYCASTGLSAMDYRLSDPHMDPPDADVSCYSEKTVRLPRTYWCYQPGGPTDEPSPPPVVKEGFVTFGCLNNFAKVSPAALDLWARILLAAPDSRMILHAHPGTHREDVMRKMQRAGVAPHRLGFVGKQPWAEYVQTYSQIDIALDPFPYGGGITTCDALWMGVPVVTLSGQTAVGRGGRSILSNLGLPELIAFNADQYVQIAIDLARNREQLVSLRQSMRDRMITSPLMDAQGFVRELEAAYRRMWRTWCETVSAG
jgi:predicted O-linked N-acetylglucosamine transferase (SPINDLY family)